jgi:hypothetical protein
MLFYENKQIYLTSERDETISSYETGLFSNIPPDGIG